MKYSLFIPFFLLLAFSFWARAAEQTPVELQGVTIDEHIGNMITPSTPFTDEQGKAVTLADFFDGKRPVLLNFVYYGCPNICTFLLNNLVTSLKSFPWTAGEEFQIVTISIDPREDAILARQKKEAYLEELGRPEFSNGWHFLTGTDASIQKITDEIGFRYHYDEEEQQYAHASALYTLTPEGKISRYLYGISFLPRDIRLALLEAADGKVGNLVDQFLLYCYHYDPKGRTYALMATNLMKLAGGATIGGVVIFLAALSRKKRKNV